MRNNMHSRTINSHRRMVRPAIKILILVLAAFLAFPAIVEAQGLELVELDTYCTVTDYRRCRRKPSKVEDIIRLTKTTSKCAQSSEPWVTNYMNLYTPMPNGGLVVSADELHVDLRITGTNQTFGHFQSKYRFLFGYFSICMKLVPKESAGVIATFYFSSPETTPDRHDEIDFEFLGNTSGNPITLQTNVYLDGVGNREQQHYLPFDPSADFHNYSLLWNEHLIIWFVDDSVIRVFHNISAKIDVLYPVSRPMAVQCSIWDGSAWATQGGLVKLNYSYAPFVAQYEGFNGVDGCQACPAYPLTACDNVDFSTCTSKSYWFHQQVELTALQVEQLTKHRRKYLVYDYCTDSKRFTSGIPAECPYNSHMTSLSEKLSLF